MRQAGRRVLITGGASGIGRACAELFAAEGATLALLDRNDHRLSDFDAISCPADVTDITAVEAAGVCTRFPHPSQLYRQLLSKEWQPALCLLPQLRIPPATMVNRATVAAAPRRAAQLACAALDEIREARYRKKPEPDALRVTGVEARKGVAKLGYAWEAAHVRIFRHPHSLTHTHTLTLTLALTLTLPTDH